MTDFAAHTCTMEPEPDGSRPAGCEPDRVVAHVELRANSAQEQDIDEWFCFSCFESSCQSIALAAAQAALASMGVRVAEIGIVHRVKGVDHIEQN